MTGRVHGRWKQGLAAVLAAIAACAVVIGAASPVAVAQPVESGPAVVGARETRRAAEAEPAAPLMVNVLQRIFFDGSEVGPGDSADMSYEWDLGDGFTAQGVSVYHFYAATGAYRVVVTATDAGGRTFQGSREVWVFNPRDVRFADLSPSHRFFDPIQELCQRDVFSGFFDGTFRPEEGVKRAQLAKILVTALGLHTAEVEWQEARFQDVPQQPIDPISGQSYPYDFVEEVAASGLMVGTPAGDGVSFLPFRPVTRGQLAQALFRAGKDFLGSPPPDYSLGFTDLPLDLSEAVAWAKYHGLLDGKTIRTYGATEQATRGQVAKILWNLLQALDGPAD